MSEDTSNHSFIDLFSGCGGFTLGLLRAGFQCLAAVDFNQQAIETLKENLAEKKRRDFSPVRHVLQRDLTKFLPTELAGIIGKDRIDVVVGGPPCQGFSTARQRDGSNHGTQRLKKDIRRHLFRNFLDFVDYFQPKVFVIENVPGLRSAAGGLYFTAVQHEARILGRDKGRPGYRVHPQIEHSEELGTPQKRRRQFIIGVRDDLVGFFNPNLRPPGRAVVGAMLGDAILDLPRLDAGKGENETHYDLRRRNQVFLSGKRHQTRKSYLLSVAEIDQALKLSNHVARPHNQRDLDDFAIIPEGLSSAVLLRRGVTFKFPYKTTSFKDRYTRQHRGRPCSTIVAHLAKDGLMFIHPTQNRSLTPREAARVQTFPDWFVFPEARTHSFRLIGNAVPPLVAEAIGNSIRRFLATPLESPLTITHSVDHSQSPRLTAHQILPKNFSEAVHRLEPVNDTRATPRILRSFSTEKFLSAWFALLWLFPDLHPDNAKEHGKDRHDDTLSRRFGGRFTRTGWPVLLAGLGREAWRRFEAGELSDEMLYCVEAQRAGLESIRCSIPPEHPRPDRGQ